jgi:hypothetical protein
MLWKILSMIGRIIGLLATTMAVPISNTDHIEVQVAVKVKSAKSIVKIPDIRIAPIAIVLLTCQSHS